MPSTGPASTTVFVSAQCPDVRFYWFLGDTAEATLNGVLVDGAGNQVSASVSVTIPVLSAGVTNPVNLFNLIEAEITTWPDSACGFIGDLDQDVRWTTFDLNGVNATSFTADFNANPTNYPTLIAQPSLRFGSAAVV